MQLTSQSIANIPTRGGLAPLLVAQHALALSISVNSNAALRPDMPGASAAPGQELPESYSLYSCILYWTVVNWKSPCWNQRSNSSCICFSCCGLGFKKTRPPGIKGPDRPTTTLSNERYLKRYPAFPSVQHRIAGWLGQHCWSWPCSRAQFLLQTMRKTKYRAG